jgi:acyl carrier protein
MISNRLKRTILSALNLDEFDLLDETVAGEVPGWDSLSHGRVICAIEAEYGTRFKSLEFLKLRTSAIFRPSWIGIPSVEGILAFRDQHFISKCKIDKMLIISPDAEHYDRVRQREIDGPSDKGGTLLNARKPFPGAGEQYAQH